MSERKLHVKVIHIHTDIDDFDAALESAFLGKAAILYRMRLSCTFYDLEGKELGKKGDGEAVFYFYSLCILCAEHLFLFI